MEWYALRPVELDFLDEAPMRVDIDVSTLLPRDVVWGAFVDPTTWKDWFPRVRDASYPDQDPPYGVGTVRAANVDGEFFEETILDHLPKPHEADGHGAVGDAENFRNLPGCMLRLRVLHHDHLLEL